MANLISKLTDAQLTLLLTTLQTGLEGDAAAYGLAPEDLERLALAANRLQDALHIQERAEAVKLAATQQKLSAREDVVVETQSLARRIYAHPTVTDAMLAAVGFEPRRGRGVRRTPQTPLGFQAEPDAKGFVRFAWDRNGNPPHTVFCLQQWAQENWITLAAVTRQSLTLEGFLPGVEARFRVIATLANRSSQPSNEFTIYTGLSPVRASRAA